MTNLLTSPWPWYIGGPLIGLMVPVLLILGNKAFGISSSFRHVCAACLPTKVDFFKYDWKKESWNIYFALGVIAGGVIAAMFMQNPNDIAISDSTVNELYKLGITNQSGLVPVEIFNLDALFTLKGFVIMVLGGFLVGFGTRYAGGCTSGHSISGMSNLQLPSLIATCCFFGGGLTMTHLVMPYLLKL